MTITTINMFLSKFVFPILDYKERIYYSCPRIIEELINKGEIRINGEIVSGINQEVYEGDIVYFDGKECPFTKGLMLYSWLDGR